MRFFRFPILFFTITFFLTGCYNVVPPVVPLKEAHRKFVETMKKEHGLNVVLKPLDNTVWIYLPMEQDLFDMQANPQGPQKSDQPAVKKGILFLDSQFADGRVDIRYDIADSKTYPRDLGYTSKYSENFQAAQRNLLITIPRVYSEVERVPGDVEYIDQARDIQHDRFVKAHVKTDKVPDFCVIVITDIRKGVETRMLIHLQDLQQGMTNSFFMDEYTKRLIFYEPEGNAAAVGDKEGKHLDAREITWPEFLTEQILYRIKFKYQRSDFPPGDDTEEEILKIVNETLSGYKFDALNGVKLFNLHDDKTYLFDKNQLKTFQK